MRKIVAFLILAGVFLLGVFLGSAPRPKIVLPDRILEKVEWVPEDLQKDIAFQTIWQTEGASSHLVRLKGAEKLHVHDAHDGTVFVLKGRAEIFLKDRWVALSPGDVIEIPRGVLHKARNKGKEPCEVYVVFRPAFDGKDTRVVE